MYRLTETETVLPDDYPMYLGYVYIVDNRLTRCPAITFVKQYKEMFDAKEIRRCEIIAHPGAKVGDMVYSSYYKI